MQAVGDTVGVLTFEVVADPPILGPEDVLPVFELEDVFAKTEIDLAYEYGK